MKIKHADVKRIKKICRKNGVRGVYDLDLDIEEGTYTFYDDDHIMHIVDINKQVISYCK